METIQIWHVIVTFAVIGVVMLMLRRWSPGFSFGVVGLVLIVTPSAFAYFSPHKLTLVEAMGPIIGAIVLGADLAGKFRRKGRPEDDASK